MYGSKFWVDFVALKNNAFAIFAIAYFSITQSTAEIIFKQFDIWKK